MRTFLVLILVASMLVLAAPVAADAPEFPDFTPMAAGPEGVVVDNVGNVYVSVGFDEETTKVWKFDPVGNGEEFATLPGPSTAGLAVDASGEHVYAAQQFAGVFKIDMDGNWALVPGTDAIAVPNSLAFDKEGNLYITETFSYDLEKDGVLDYYPFCDVAINPEAIFDGWFGRGGIWVVPKGGEAQLLLRHDLLTGVCAPVPIPYPIGANGLAYRYGSLFVANTEKALLLEIPVLEGGELGDISIIAGLTEVVNEVPPMIDGIALDVHGNIYAAIVSQSTIVRVSHDGEQIETVATWEDGLTFPASLAFGTLEGERKSVFVTNLAFEVPPGFFGPGLAKIDLGFTVPASATFVDVPVGYGFFGDVEWLVSEGITKGCNPPDNDQFCPDESVTRGQMAAFMVRAFGYSDRGSTDFVDDDGSIFEADIERLAAAGVTKGCNPPDNDQFCPDESVTRGQMAAFLVRALGYTNDGGGNLFTDDDGSIFEDAIDKLGTAGVTKGCNPPDNDQFCPDESVTRGQMAALLYRGLN
ncbi:MAG: SMP-30/gluconolactonase/LRE family protein [Acidimicrobiia bacterium]|nr:SMP-30/gluconolactonase/LRE family protein [Acidimicrobiia bacterium]MDX2466706.1 SMP-30/gluconolactonase/LRE family protein [Acidimicrobiia bacterium]